MLLLVQACCKWCGTPFYVCRPCWRGQCYCCDTCRHAAKAQQRREAQRKYRSTDKGKKNHCEGENRRRHGLSKKNHSRQAQRQFPKTDKYSRCRCEVENRPPGGLVEENHQNQEAQRQDGQTEKDGSGHREVEHHCRDGLDKENDQNQEAQRQFPPTDNGNRAQREAENGPPDGLNKKNHRDQKNMDDASSTPLSTGVIERLADLWNRILDGWEVPRCQFCGSPGLVVKKFPRQGYG